MAEFLIKKARLAFGKGVFVKEGISGDASSKPAYRAKFIIPTDHPQLAELRALEEQVAKEKYGDKLTEYAGEKIPAWDAVLRRLRKTDDKHLLRDGDTQRSDGFSGNLYISASNDTRPTAYGLRPADGEVTLNDGVIYSGCYVNVKVDIWAMDNGFGQRINADLLGVQFAGDGDSFSAGAPPAKPDDFPELSAEDAGDEVDPFA